MVENQVCPGETGGIIALSIDIILLNTSWVFPLSKLGISIMYPLSDTEDFV